MRCERGWNPSRVGVETLRRARAVDVEQSAQVSGNAREDFVRIQQLRGENGAGGDVSSTGKNCGCRKHIWQVNVLCSRLRS